MSHFEGPGVPPPHRRDHGCRVPLAQCRARGGLHCPYSWSCAYGSLGRLEFDWLLAWFLGSSSLRKSYQLSRDWKWKWLSPVQLFVTPRTVHGILQARVLGWVAFAFSRGSSQPRGQTQVSCAAGRFFTSWAIREAHLLGIRKCEKWSQSVVSDSLWLCGLCPWDFPGKIPGVGSHFLL